MKKVENNFAVTGFIGKDAEIRQFTNSSVARFSLAVRRTEKRGEEQEEVRVSAFMNVEAWRKNNSASFELLKKGTIFVATKFYEPVEKPEKKEKAKGKAKSKKEAA